MLEKGMRTRYIEQIRNQPREQIMAATNKPEKSESDAETKKLESEKKWGKAVIKVGFLIAPSLLFRAQGRLGLSPVQLVILLHMADAWWFKSDLPWPSKRTLADRLGLSERQVQRHLHDLEKAGFIKINARFAKNQGQLSNEYDLSGLVSKIKKLEPEFTQLDAERRALRERQELVTKKGGLAVSKLAAAAKQ